MRKRSGKFYSRNEKQTLKALGLEPAPMSGAGWIIKEDGENEVAMVQLKSTDSSSYKLEMLDLKKLEYHAEVSNKVPIFLVQFLKQDKIYAIVEVGNIGELNEALTTGSVPQRITFKEEEIDQQSNLSARKIKASKKAREEFFKERSAKFGKK
jgi:hypothetical protein